MCLRWLIQSNFRWMTATSPQDSSKQNYPTTNLQRLRKTGGARFRFGWILIQRTAVHISRSTKMPHELLYRPPPPPSSDRLTKLQNWDTRFPIPRNTNMLSLVLEVVPLRIGIAFRNNISGVTIFSLLIFYYIYMIYKVSNFVILFTRNGTFHEK